MQQTITLTFTQDDMKILSEALVSLPFKQVAGLINSINVQVNIQEQAAKENAKQEAE